MTSSKSLFNTGANMISALFSKSVENKSSTYIDYDSDFDVYSDSDTESMNIKSTKSKKSKKSKKTKGKNSDRMNTGLLSKKKILHIGATLQGNSANHENQ